ncbi:alanine--glyoxylate aminotransferase family protein [Candidatus Poribacteria bacterium]|nr:alanine--glyoxylate aminotransferase family protein [Candidatus Poribacteria bacterium]
MSTETYSELDPSARLLMGPGPSMVHPRVLKAMSTPLLGHLDPEFLRLMNETMDLLRRTFGTANELTIPISATGSAGMEAALCNIIEPGDQVVICVNGVFGERMSDIVGRCGGVLTRVDAPWGRAFEPEQIEAALRSVPKPKAVAIVHAETSTGVLQPLADIAKIVRNHGALFVVDTVTSLGGAPIEADATGIDVSYSGTQKCLSCPPGLSPITFGPRAMEVINGRKSKVQSWYLDMTMVSKYWGSERLYHHTAPISMVYALREALRIVHEEGLAARYERHRLHAAALGAGLEAMGLKLAAQDDCRAPMLTLTALPDGADDAAVRRRLLLEHGVEIGGGLGVFKGKMWRIGLMGETARRSSVLTCLDALGASLGAEGCSVDAQAGLAAAQEVYASASGAE